MIEKRKATFSQGGSSFFIGVAIGAVGLYFLGTKHGRTILKKAMGAAEELEKSADDLINELEKTVEEDFDIEAVTETIVQKEKQLLKTVESTNMFSVMERIKSVLPHNQKKSEKYVSKNGVIVK